MESVGDLTCVAFVDFVGVSIEVELLVMGQVMYSTRTHTYNACIYPKLSSSKTLVLEKE